jgi:hypothetical protein
MRASRATKSADSISRWSALTAIVASGALMFCVALPLALSSPFPTPREREWIVEGSPVRAATLAPMGRDVSAALEEDAEEEPEPALQTQAALPQPDESAKPDTKPDTKPDSRAGWPRATTASLSADPEPTGSLPPRTRTDIMDEVDDYLWEVYRRAPVKRDSSGDFTWKDPAAAKRMGMPLKTYVIAGMDRDFREQLYHAGKAMDAAGINWAMLSAFRDDYRQRLASGFKASGGNSLHGGSRRTGGYGHGRAVDVTGGDGAAEAVWRWLDAHGGRYGLSRPMPGPDPAHIQPRGDWRAKAIALRSVRTRTAHAGTRQALGK